MAYLGIHARHEEAACGPDPVYDALPAVLVDFAALTQVLPTWDFLPLGIGKILGEGQ
jgi:hypothetical protein